MTKAPSSHSDKPSSSSKSKAPRTLSLRTAKRKFIIKLSDRVASAPIAMADAAAPIAITDYPAGCNCQPLAQLPPSTLLARLSSPQSQRRLLEQDNTSDTSDLPPRHTRVTASRDSASRVYHNTPTSAPAPTQVTTVPSPAQYPPTATYPTPPPVSITPPQGNSSHLPTPLSNTDCTHLMWFSFSVHEYLNT